MKAARILLLLVVVLLALSPLDRQPNSVRAQTEQAAPTTPEVQNPTPQPDPPGTIDGAKNPELIPDEVAWKMLFLAIAEPINATDEQKARARGKLAQALLSEDDTDAFLRLMGEFHQGMADMDNEMMQIRARNPFPHTASTDYSRLLELSKQRKQLIADTTNALPARLSEEGLKRLHAHLQREKRGMKLIPEPK